MPIRKSRPRKENTDIHVRAKNRIDGYHGCFKRPKVSLFGADNIYVKFLKDGDYKPMCEDLGMDIRKLENHTSAQLRKLLPGRYPVQVIDRIIGMRLRAL